MITAQVRQNRDFRRVTNLVNPSGSRAAARPRSNPAPLLLTLGAVNPTKGVIRMAAKKKAKARSGAKGKANPTVSISSLKSMLSRKKKAGGRKNGHRNPALFGQTRPTKILGVLAGVAGGVTAVKLISPMLPASWQETDLSRFLTSAGVAIATAVGAHMLLAEPYRDAVVAGAGAQTLSVGLNPVVRKVLPSSPGLMGGRGLRDFVPGNFPEPHNPIYQRMLAAGAASMPGAMAGGNIGRYQGRFAS